MNDGSAILFDLDGLLIDSQPIWRAAETRMFAAMGHAYDPDIVREYLGMNASDVAATAFRILQPPGELGEYQRLMREAMVQEYGRGDITSMPGAAECVRRLHGLAPMAVASGSPRAGIAKAVERLGIAECFEEVLSSESVPRGKPAPDVFLAAADCLGAVPHRCVVFEDSLHGVESGKAAGMTVVAVPSPSQDRARIERMADMTLASLADVTCDHVQSRLR